MFKYAIVRRPSHSLIDGISQTPEMGKPDYDLALQQHDRYVEILRECGLEVTVLEANEDYPVIIISIDSLANGHALHVKRYFNHIIIKTDIAGMLFIKNDTHNKAECKIIFSAK